MTSSNRPSKHKQRFMDKYAELVDYIKPKHFEHFYEHAPNHRTIEIFKAGLLDSFATALDSIWEPTNTDENLEILDMLKSDPANGSIGKWRPTGKSAEEQVLPLLINQLKWQKKMFDRQIAYQKNSLEEAVAKLEVYRQKMVDIAKRRKFLHNAITEEMRAFDNIDLQVTDIGDTVILELQR